tara:strand:- start:151 stop:462 length:312 start_codon:yes stop_codon:yes gene_type:complete
MILITTTSDSEKILKKIASELLRKKLSPCTHIYKIDQSGYIWENQIVYEIEYKLEIKTIKSYQSDIISIIKKNHNYTIYELNLLDIFCLNPDYEQWFINEIKK